MFEIAAFWGSEPDDLICLTDAHGNLTRAELLSLADHFQTLARAALPDEVERPLVALEMVAEVGAIAAYLGCLRADWPVILLSSEQSRDLDQTSIIGNYLPNLIVTSEGREVRVTCHSRTLCDMAEDLGVLLSTSGTTGATKLVMLSRENIRANAEAIVDYLSIRREDVAVTTLPLHYSYGMSVLNSYLQAGARVVLTSKPILHPSFWALATDTGVTSLALVPSQFQLLAGMEFGRQRLPTLRYVTQAGGRLDPGLGHRFVEQARKEGWELYVMYGQTEASPRISYVPPSHLPDALGTIGRPIPGGRLWLEDDRGREVNEFGVAGELIYAGPNVMLGYALSRSDMARPERPAFLRTGDIAERLPDGTFRITGRSSRFVKLFGLRVGLDEVEMSLRARGLAAFVSGSDEGLVVFFGASDADVDEAETARWVADRLGLPQSVIHVVRLGEVPLLSSGKIDYRALSRQAAERIAASKTTGAPRLVEELGRILRSDAIDTSLSFRELGGDSLAYIEAELLLSRRLGHVPEGWSTRPISELATMRSDKVAGTKVMVAPELPLRIICILAVVFLHATGIGLSGGVYLLSILAGFSMARFQYANLIRGYSATMLIAMLLPLLLAYYAVLIPLSAYLGADLEWFILTANFLAAEGEVPEPAFLLPYWYVAAYAQVLVGTALLFSLGFVRRAASQAPFLFGMTCCAILGLLMLTSYVGQLAPGRQVRHPLGTGELVALGWCIAMAESSRDKLWATILVIASYLLLWRETGPSISAFLLAGPLLLLWAGAVPVPVAVSRALLGVGVLTLFIYIAHVPALYIGRHFFDAPSMRFLTTLALSLAAATAMRQVLPRVLAEMQRIAELRHTLLGARRG